MTTPMRSQYLELKRQYPGVILFFRLGDFYETFDEDARIVAAVCDVVLTSRPVGGDLRVPLAGVPYHAVDGYIARLIASGHKVAIAEQIGSEPPKGEKLVPRVVRRVVTPGTLVEPGLLAGGSNNYIAALVFRGDAAGLAYADITTGEFAATELRSARSHGSDTVRTVADELSRLAPAELVVAAQEAAPLNSDSTQPGALQPGPLEAVLGAVSSKPHLTRWPAWHFEDETARSVLLGHFAVSSLESFGCEGWPLAAQAAGALLAYLRETQRSGLGQLSGLRTYSTADFMLLDEATRSNLELTANLRTGQTMGSLLGVLDETESPMGARLLRRRLNQPLIDIQQLETRLDSVSVLAQDAFGRAAVRRAMKGMGDLERWTNRCVQGIAGPRDLVGLRGALRKLAEVHAALEGVEGRPALWEPVDTGIVLDLLDRALSDNPPAALGGGVIRPGYSSELDGIHVATRAAKEWIANLEGLERQRTGIRSLKVGYNKVFGYYLEVTQANTSLVPPEYIRKQTLVNAERYVTPELREYEALVLHAEERVTELESSLFADLVLQVGSKASELLAVAAAIADLDVSASLAEAAENYGYVRPELADDGIIDVENGRHPVVERSLGSGAFVPNDVALSPEQEIVILTGPNMSGKSTYLRQVAHIVLMAQIGSFVPARRAHIGVVDRIFTRIGAADDIARGQSTFMVEMVETANILHNATPRSLLILDEIGRGTSTYDGLAIAWAVVEYIHNQPSLRSKTLFATHYQELTDLAERLPHVVNRNVAVAEHGDDVVFLHQIIPGSADRSYGVHVAQIAGLPRPVIARAQQILADLEESGAAGPRRSQASPAIYQLQLFSAEDPVLAELAALDIDALSPLDALNKLFELQQRARKR